MFDTKIDSNIDTEKKCVSIAEVFLEISYFTVIRTVCLSKSDVVNLLENCFEDENFEFSVIFADCVENAAFWCRTNCKIKTDLVEFIVFRVDVWAIDEDFEFSMKSTIEYSRVDSKSDVFEFFFETEKIESDVLIKKSYERDVKLKFE